MADFSERRRHPRVDVNLVVRSRALDLTELPLLTDALGQENPPIPPLQLGKQPHHVTDFNSVNLSLGGFSVDGDLTLDSEKPYVTGSDLVLEFDLLDGQAPIRAVAQVMWVKPEGGMAGRHQVGLMFLLLPQAAYVRIKAFVEKNTQN